MKRRILVFFLSLTISHTYTNEQIFTNFITSPTSNQIYIPSRVKFSSNLVFEKFISQQSFPSREKHFRSPKWWSIPLGIPTVVGISSGKRTRAPLSRKSQPACTESQRLKISRRDCFEFVSRCGEGAVHVNNSRSPCERVSFSTEQRASNSSFFRPTLESDIVLLSSRRSLHPTSRESGG